MNILTASALDAYLDQTDAALKQQEAADVAPELIEAGLQTAMRNLHFRADTMPSVDRLFKLWMRAGDPDAGLRVLDSDGRDVVAALPQAERDDWRISIAMWRINAYKALGDRAALLAQFDAALTLLASLPDSANHRSAWSYLDNRLTEAGAHALERRSAEATHARFAADPVRGVHHAWNASNLARRQAGSYWREGDREQARLAAQRAIDILAGAGADQEIGYDEWLRLGLLIGEIVPDAISGVVAQARACIPAGSNDVVLRAVEVRIARVEGMTLFYQGALEQAVASLKAGRIRLAEDEDERFSAAMLLVLQQAGRHEDMARLAFELIFLEYAGAAEQAVGDAQRAVAAGLAGQPYWHLALACAGMAAGTAAVREGEDQTSWVRRHLALARAQGGAHPAADAIEGLLLLQTTGDYQGALPLLEAAVRDPSLAHADLVYALWVTRVHVHGGQAALAMPFVPAASAMACNTIGTRLSCLFDTLPPEDRQEARAAIEPLCARYYEEGLARADAFLASGEGDAGDGHAKVYSALCSGLAMHYFYFRSQPAMAMSLHIKGMGAAQFPEHYRGLLNCYIVLGNHAAMVVTAEQLWQFAADHGYSRHDPATYIPTIAEALRTLGRDTDIAIWLQRLDEWMARLEPKERAGQQGNYLRALVTVLHTMMPTQPDDAMLRLESVLPALPAAACPLTSMMAAHILRDAGHFERAMAEYRKALSYISTDANHLDERHKPILAGLAECQRLQRQAKPWWKVW